MRLLKIGGFGIELSRKLANILAKGWRPLISKDSTLEEDFVGKSRIVSSKENSTSSILSFKLIESRERNMSYYSLCLPLWCIQLNFHTYEANFRTANLLKKS